MDAAGEIDAVGEGVQRRSGERVMAVVFPRGPHGGAYAERVVVPMKQVAAAPASWTTTEACTLPMNGLTARQALDILNLAPGQLLAVTGAAGAVGGYVVQLAKHAGLRVVADAAPFDAALVNALGADVVVRRGPDVAERIREVAHQGVDALVDCAVIGGPVLAAVRDRGAVAAVREFAGAPTRNITVHQVRVAAYADATDKLDELRQLAEAGVLTARVAATVPLEDAAEAHRCLEAGGVRGRLVLVS
jgi:NADPH:quinone reductase-like Zn-dependent oxidoreductase